jgi:hypothetical protein
MTDPDEALWWARAQGYRALALEIAEAYRAGAAASEARIKALEEALQPLAHATLRYPEVLGLTTEDVMTARALMKEADQ